MAFDIPIEMGIGMAIKDGYMYVLAKGGIFKIASNGDTEVYTDGNGWGQFQDDVDGTIGINGTARFTSYGNSFKLGPDGNFYFSSKDRTRIRRMTSNRIDVWAGSLNSELSTIANDATLVNATFGEVGDYAWESNGKMWVTDGIASGFGFLKNIVNGNVTTVLGRPLSNPQAEVPIALTEYDYDLTTYVSTEDMTPHPGVSNIHPSNITQPDMPILSISSLDGNVEFGGQYAQQIFIISAVDAEGIEFACSDVQVITNVNNGNYQKQIHFVFPTPPASAVAWRIYDLSLASDPNLMEGQIFKNRKWGSAVINISKGLCVDNDDNLYIGAYGGGVWHFDTTTNRLAQVIRMINNYAGVFDNAFANGICNADLPSVVTFVSNYAVAEYPYNIMLTSIDANGVESIGVKSSIQTQYPLSITTPALPNGAVAFGLYYNQIEYGGEYNNKFNVTKTVLPNQTYDFSVLLGEGFENIGGDYTQTNGKIAAVDCWGLMWHTPSSKLWVVDQGCDRIIEYDPATTWCKNLVGPGAGPVDVINEPWSATRSGVLPNINNGTGDDFGPRAGINMPAYVIPGFNTNEFFVSTWTFSIIKKINAAIQSTVVPNIPKTGQLNDEVLVLNQELVSAIILNDRVFGFDTVWISNVEYYVGRYRGYTYTLAPGESVEVRIKYLSNSSIRFQFLSDGNDIGQPGKITDSDHQIINQTQITNNDSVPHPFTLNIHTANGYPGRFSLKMFSTPVVTLTPSDDQTINPNETLQITASSPVTWFVNDIENGNDETGRITTSGNIATYTAPNFEFSAWIRVVSKIDDFTSSGIYVNVVSGVSEVTSIDLNYTNDSVVRYGGTKDIGISIGYTGNPSLDIYWTVDGVLNGSASVGLISGSGDTVTYQALDIPSGVHMIMAQSVSNPSITATAHIYVGSARQITGIAFDKNHFNVSIDNTVEVTPIFSGNGDLSSATATFYVDGIENGNSSIGTIVAENGGFFYYPTTIGSYTIQAKSNDDPTLIATCYPTVVSSSNHVDSVSLSYTNLTVDPSSSNSLSATVNYTGVEDGSVTWTSNGPTINGTGNYITFTAPSTPGDYWVKATSYADSSVSNTCNVHVRSISATPVSITTTSLAIGSGGNVTFGALLNGSPSSAVDWAVDGHAGGNATVGYITTGGVYTCPSVSVPTYRTITATSQADSSVGQIRIATVISNVRTALNPSGDTTGFTDRSNIKNALDNAGSGIVQLHNTGTWYIKTQYNDGAGTEWHNGIYLNANNTLLCDPGVTIITPRQTVFGAYSLIAMEEINTTLVGGTTVGDRALRTEVVNDNDGSDQGSGQGLSIYDFENGNGVIMSNCDGPFLVIGHHASEHCNDGCYVTNGGPPANNFTILDSIFHHNRRQGVSIVAGSHGLLDNVTMSGTQGQDPGCGIDFEPNTENINDITLKNCHIFDNMGGGIVGGSTHAKVSNIYLLNCDIHDNGGEDYGVGGIAANDGANNWTVDGCDIYSNRGYNDNYWGGIMFHEASNMTVTNNNVHDNLNGGITMYNCAHSAFDFTGSQSHASGNTTSGNTGSNTSYDSTVTVS